MVPVLQGKRVVLGVTGSIAVYKAVALASTLYQAGAIVEVIMTEAATRFVAPLSFQAIIHRPVHTSMWNLLAETEIGHVTLGRLADVLVVAPATADILTRLALGLADDFLTTTALACTAPMIIAPAMETHMYQHPAIQGHLGVLKSRGVYVVGPEAGHLASGATGLGRLAAEERIVDTIRLALGRGGNLARRGVVVTAGGTQEPLDPVRYIGNRSSGKMGVAVAEAARDHGAQVTLIYGAMAQPQTTGVRLVSAPTAQTMHAAVMEALPQAHALVMAAAVADFQPAIQADQKIKKKADTIGLTVELIRTPDILAAAGSCKPVGCVIVGFAAETENLIANARQKLEQKGADLIVANPVPATFGTDESDAAFVGKEGEAKSQGRISKVELAERIVNWIALELLQNEN
ncbi:MAG: bifunctional phosphopantothenoylcysteine decarboxylase/phosphopantothenate--cysteine ligase CoaBC [Chloroflexi bacterium]|nr:bifunctional phosphopantothenoylcysteine decarboxylase/phosphopantothenate--cysteine ligase CoaBC [Chloroflexota bacterium]